MTDSTKAMVLELAKIIANGKTLSVQDNETITKPCVDEDAINEFITKYSL